MKLGEAAAVVGDVLEDLGARAQIEAPVGIGELLNVLAGDGRFRNSNKGPREEVS